MTRRIAPYWYAILFVFALSAVLFGYHLATGYTPLRAAFTIIGFPVYWYGIWIITGIGLGSWVVSRLAAERACHLYEAAVPDELRQRPLAEAGLSTSTVELLGSRGMTTLGQLLWEIGLDPRRLNHKRVVTEGIMSEVTAVPGVDSAWLANAPWRVWNPDHVWNALLWILVLGVIGARLYHILTPSPSMAAVGIFSPLDYLRDPLQMLNFRGGGLGIFGGLAGGLLGMLIYTRRSRIPFLDWADLAVVGLALGQAIGRWGNFFNQELYGRPTGLPWAIHIDPVYRLPDYATFERFHPAFLYESLWSLITFAVLWWLARRHGRRLLPGEMTALYLIAYAVGRTMLEMVRLDSRAVAFFGLESGLAVATLVSIAIALVVAVLVLARRLRRRRTAVG